MKRIALLLTLIVCLMVSVGCQLTAYRNKGIVIGERIFIVGHASDLAGAPLENVQVTLFYASDDVPIGDSLRVTHTEEDGSYILDLYVLHKVKPNQFVIQYTGQDLKTELRAIEMPTGKFNITMQGFHHIENDTADEADEEVVGEEDAIDGEDAVNDDGSDDNEGEDEDET